jgi:alkanesulfonate monooxygenase SsuD/methylene tetrahydromethanopterin reductase-like flavin-dependent oxidoreductase (luciferase family)
LTVPSSLRLAIALDGAGWHPAAWRLETARPAELLTAQYWADVIREAERGLVDFVTVEDSLGLQSSDFAGPDGRTDQVRGRLDAVLVAASAAPRSRYIGLVPTAVLTHTEPFHISKAIATLDYASLGRAGVHVSVSARPDVARHFGRRLPLPPRATDLYGEAAPALFDEAADYVEVVRRLWDSWEDDAEIRDATSGRFIDRARLHYIDFSGCWFSVKGPSITPRPPQGQPVVSALAHGAAGYQLIGRAADVGYVVPRDLYDARSMVAAIRGEQEIAGRMGHVLHVFADVVVFLDGEATAAMARKARLDELAGDEYESDAIVFCGSPAQLADLLQEWHEGGVSGFRLRPGAVPDDLEAITRGLVPELQARGVFRRSYEAGTLRGLLGMARPVNRYVAA